MSGTFSACAWCLLLAVGLQPAAAPSPAAAGAGARRGPTLQAVPYPALDGLDPAVARQLDAARTRLETAIHAGRADAALFGEAGREYHAYELGQAALACYANAEALAPEDFRWPYLSAVLLEKIQQAGAARDAYRRALRRPERYYPALVRLAALELALGDLDSALATLEPARQHAPDDAALLATLGELALTRGQAEEARRHLEAALRQQPRANRLHYPLAMAWRALGRIEESRAELAKAGPVGVRPRDPLLDEVLALRRGEAAFASETLHALRAGDYAAALAAAQKAFAASHGTSPAALVNMAAAARQLGRSAEALEYLERARRLDPDAPAVLFNLGLLLNESRRPAEAEAALRRLLALAPQDDAARVELAQALLAQARAVEALAALDGVRQIEGPRCRTLAALATQSAPGDAAAERGRAALAGCAGLPRDPAPRP